MDPARLERVRTAIRDEVSAILRGFKDPRLGFVSVTDVEVSKDARVAKIFVSVLGDEQAKKDTLKALTSGTSFVRRELGQRLQLRHVPEIIFRFDNSIERGTRIQSLLRELGPEDNGLAGEPQPPGSRPTGNGEG